VKPRGAFKATRGKPAAGPVKLPDQAVLRDQDPADAKDEQESRLKASEATFV